MVAMAVATVVATVEAMVEAAGKKHLEKKNRLRLCLHSIYVDSNRINVEASFYHTS